MSTRYIFSENRTLRCRELIDSHTGAVIDSVDYDASSSRHSVALTLKRERLNAEWEAQVELLNAGAIPTQTELAADALEYSEDSPEALEAAAVAVVAQQQGISVPPKGTPEYAKLLDDTRLMGMVMAEVRDLADLCGIPFDQALTLYREAHEAKVRVSTPAALAA